MRKIPTEIKALLSCAGFILFAACSSQPPIEIKAKVNMATLSRGAAIVEGPGACAFCHGDKPLPGAVLSGGQEMTGELSGYTAPNITPSIEFGIGGWTDTQIVSALRGGLRPNASTFGSSAHDGFAWMSDDDAYAVAVYLRTLPAADIERDGNSSGGGLFGGSESKQKGFVPDLGKANPKSRGQYLVDHVAQCGVCHTSEGGWFGSSDYLGGGKAIGPAAPETKAPSLIFDDEEGRGKLWTKNDLIHYLQSGLTRSGKQIDPLSCPIMFYRRVSASDLSAMAEYIFSLSKE